VDYPRPAMPERVGGDGRDHRVGCARVGDAATHLTVLRTGPDAQAPTLARPHGKKVLQATVPTRPRTFAHVETIGEPSINLGGDESEGAPIGSPGPTKAILREDRAALTR
jgi:hypothetical protein